MTRVLILLLFLLFVDSRNDPGLWGDELLCGDTKLEQGGDGLGEAIKMSCQRQYSIPMSI